MTDVEVNQRRPDLPPIDPDVQIPDSVKKRAAAVEAFYAASGQTPLPVAEVQPVLPGPEPPSPQAAGLTEPPTEPPPAAPPPPPEPVAEAPRQQQTEPPEDWERKFRHMQGRFNAAQRTIGEMEEQMAQMGEEILNRQTAPQRPSAPPPPQPPPQYITQQDVQNYGTDLLDFTQRAAIQAVQPRLEYLQGRNEQLERQLAQEARARLDMIVETQLPNWREIDSDPRWRRWLALPDPMTGRIRQHLLDDAITAASAPRVLSCFRSFLQEEQATGHRPSEPSSSQPAAPPREAAIPLAALAAPGRARLASGGESSLPADKPFYTRAQIAQLYSEKRRGLWNGREAEWARLEQDFVKAPLEGRVRS